MEYRGFLIEFLSNMYFDIFSNLFLVFHLVIVSMILMRIEIWKRFKLSLYVTCLNIFCLDCPDLQASYAS